MMRVQMPATGTVQFSAQKKSVFVMNKRLGNTTQAGLFDEVLGKYQSPIRPVGVFIRDKERPAFEKLLGQLGVKNLPIDYRRMVPVLALLRPGDGIPENPEFRVHQQYMDLKLSLDRSIVSTMEKPIGQPWGIFLIDRKVAEPFYSPLVFEREG